MSTGRDPQEENIKNKTATCSCFEKAREQNYLSLGFGGFSKVAGKNSYEVATSH